MNSFKIQNPKSDACPHPVRQPSSSPILNAPLPRRAFTLVELLVVISIMALLAALVVAVSRLAAEKMRTSRVTTELGMYQTLLDNYQTRIGSYPPDHANTTSADPTVRHNAVARPPLFYELTGVAVTNRGGATAYISVTGEELTRAAANSAFGRPGFANASTDPAETRNFITELSASPYARVPVGSSTVNLLVIAVEGPNEIETADGRTVNTWRYNSSNPTNNPASYDLWAEIVIGGETVVIGNWKD